MFFSCCFSKTYEAPDVVELDWSHSSLTAVPESIFTYERTLEKLDISCNQISDLPPSLFHCHELRELDLCDNDITTIPPAFGKFLKLTKLDLSRNAITDVSDAMKSCKNLVYLDLSLNQLQKLPEGISQLVNLEELFLNDTYLEFLVANFGRLTKLRVLELRENSLQTLPKSMTRLAHLQRIDIGQNDIFELPEVIGTMTNLTELWCDNNSIRSLPKFIGNLTKLNCLDASQNDISEISDDIGKCIHLSDLTLASNSLEALPDSFAKLENLTVLRLDSNSIQYLPEDLGNLKNLQELTLIRNLLKSVPSSIGLMRKLHTLYLDDNLLTALPKEIGSCSALSVLSVAKNRLVTIPSEVGHLSNLKVLTLSGNLLAHLPVSLLNIAKLGALWLSDSQSKPLLPFNKEIEPSGQHVLTCYLLPQMPSTQIETTEVTNENDENILPRRSRPSIKFTDLEPPPTESNVSKRGLLRAPTPYPKELRALAKHASHLRSKEDQNGDLIINDEPEYEGDYVDGDEETGKDNENLRNKNPSNGGHFYGSNSQQQPALPVKDYAEEPIGPGRNSYRSTVAATPGPQTPTTAINNTVDQNNFQHFPTISANEPRPSVVGTDGNTFSSASKQLVVGNNGDRDAFGPPPYHVAARRAAFFRNLDQSSSPSSPSPQSPAPAIYPATRLNSTTATTVTRDGPTNHLPTATSTDPSLNIPGAMTRNNNNSGSGEIQHSIVISGTVGNNEMNRKHGDNLKHIVVNQSGGINDLLNKKIEKEDVVSSIKQSSTLTVTTCSQSGIPASSVQPKNEVADGEERQQRRIVEEIIEAASLHHSFSGNGYAVTDVQQQQTENVSHNPDQRKALTEKISTTINTVTSAATHKDLTNDTTNTGVVSNISLRSENMESLKSSTDIVVDSFRQDRASSKESSVSSMSESNQFHSNSNSGGVKHFSTTNDNTLVESSTESFSKIPVLSSPPSRISSIAIPPITSAESQVPLTTGQQSTTNTFSKIIQPSINTEVGSNTSWSRIPKLPNVTGNVANNSTIANANANVIKKPEIIGPKPSSLVRTSSDRSRIPAAESRMVNKSSQPTIPASVPTPSLLPTSSSTSSSSVSKIPRFGEQPNQQPHHHEPNKLERTLSGSRIPKYHEMPNPSKPSSSSYNMNSVDQPPLVQAPPESSPGGAGPGGSRIPTKFTQNARKPWIFGTHRNARVVPVEYIKGDNLGFTVTDGPHFGSGDGNDGIYVDTVEASDSTVKIGDKILQVDGIDVANSKITPAILRQILFNCDKSISLLVSRYDA